MQPNFRIQGELPTYNHKEAAERIRTAMLKAGLPDRQTGLMLLSPVRLRSGCYGAAAGEPLVSQAAKSQVRFDPL